jgi:prepilin-type N-terminal cleavage/methylation domain-containing protein
MKRHLFPHSLPKAKGFTMLELLVAMSVTVILLGMVTLMTGVSMDGYKGSRDKVLGGRQAKEALDAITKDFEAMVARRDRSDNMWLYAEVEPRLSTSQGGPTDKTITNACRLIFFTGALDRYDGDIDGTNDNGGDVSAVAYRLAYRDQISDTATGAVGPFPSFTLYRHLVDPDDTFTNVLGRTDLSSSNEFDDSDTFTAENVLAENIYEMTVTFLVELDAGGVKRITMGESAGQEDDLAFTGKGIQLVSGVGEKDHLAGVEISITVLSERGLVMTEKGGMTREDIIKDYGIHFTHTVDILPRF